MSSQQSKSRFPVEPKQSNTDEGVKPTAIEEQFMDSRVHAALSGPSAGSPEKDYSVGSRDKPMSEDPRELIPGTDPQASRVEELLLQVISENRMLRQRLDQVETYSNWRGIAPGGQNGPLSSPVSLAPPPGFGGLLPSAAVQTGSFRAVQQFVMSDLQGPG